MKISTKGTYALEIIVDLAMHSEPDRLASLKDSRDAEEGGTNKQYTRSVWRILSCKGGRGYHSP